MASQMYFIQSIFATVCLATLALQAGMVDATARFGQSNTVKTRPSELPTLTLRDGTYQQLAATTQQTSILSTATERLQSTFAAWNIQSSPSLEASLFPDVVDTSSGEWHNDELTANGAAGLLAGAMWTMHRLTGSDEWRERAQAATEPLLDASSDQLMGQSLATLIYPAIRYAYEFEQDVEQRQVYLDAALDAADTISKLYVRVLGVFKVRPTSDIAAEARAAGAAAISPLAVFSSVEGSAAATSLLVWASALPGGRPAWLDMALSNARHIATDHLRADGSVRSTLVYKATSATAKPQELATIIKPFGDQKDGSIMTAMFGSVNGSSVASAGVALDAWLSSIAGKEASDDMRQALAALALSEAAKAATIASDISSLTAAAEAAAAPLVNWAAEEAAIVSAEPVVAAAAAAALSELASLTTVSQSQRDAYASTARHIVATLASSNLGAPRAASVSSPLSSAGRWLSGLLAATTPESTQQHHRARLLRGTGSHAADTVSARSSPVSILVGVDGLGGCMLADSLLLQAMLRLAELETRI